MAHLRGRGPLDFALTGVMASLADAGVSIFGIATYDTDYVLARAANVGPDLRGFTCAATPPQLRCVN